MATTTQKPNPFIQTPKEGAGNSRPTTHNHIKNDPLFGSPWERQDLDGSYGGNTEVVTIQHTQEGPVLGSITFKTQRVEEDVVASESLGTYDFILNSKTIEITSAPTTSVDTQPAAEQNIRVDALGETRDLAAQDVVVEKTDLFKAESILNTTTIVSGAAGKLVEGVWSQRATAKAAVTELIWEDIMGSGDKKPAKGKSKENEGQTKEQILAKATKQKEHRAAVEWNAEVQSGQRQAQAAAQMQEQIHDGTAGMSAEQVSQEAGYNNTSNEANVNTKANRVAIVLKRAAQFAKALLEKSKKFIKSPSKQGIGGPRTQGDMNKQGESTAGVTKLTG